MRMNGRWSRRLWGTAALAVALGFAAPAPAQSVAEIRAVQQRLTELGYDPGEVDGLMGSRTREAIAAFQADVGMERTGQITLQLLNILGANPNAPRPLEEIQARLVDIIGARWEQAEQAAPRYWTPPPEEARPRFADHPADGPRNPLVAHVDFASNPDAALFTDALTAAIGEPPDFAGRYRIVQVGCGTSCQAALAVDAATGQVVTGPTAELGIDYRADSRLLVVNPIERVTAVFAEDQIPPWAATRWFLFDGSRFLPLTPVVPAAGDETAASNEAAAAD